jgi:hypothetical protein
MIPNKMRAGYFTLAREKPDARRWGHDEDD